MVKHAMAAGRRMSAVPSRQSTGRSAIGIHRLPGRAPITGLRRGIVQTKQAPLQPDGQPPRPARPVEPIRPNRHP